MHTFLEKCTVCFRTPKTWAEGPGAARRGAWGARTALGPRRRRRRGARWVGGNKMLSKCIGLYALKIGSLRLEYRMSMPSLCLEDRTSASNIGSLCLGYRISMLRISDVCLEYRISMLRLSDFCLEYRISMPRISNFYASYTHMLTRFKKNKRVNNK